MDRVLLFAAAYGIVVFGACLLFGHVMMKSAMQDTQGGTEHLRRTKWWLPLLALFLGLSSVGFALIVPHID